MKKDVRSEYTPRKNVWFYFTSIVSVHFSHKTEKFWFWESLNFKNDVRFEYVLSNSVWFDLNFIVWVEFWQKVEKYGF